jgi:ABC-type sugar transport system substrate-binding protein
VFETNMTALSAHQGLDAAQDALTRYPDVDVVFAQNDDLAVGIVQALEEKGRAGDVVVTGLDATPEGLELLRKGNLSMTVALPPRDWGATGLQVIVDAVRGKEVRRQVPVETFVVDDSNINDFTQEELEQAVQPARARERRSR